MTSWRPECTCVDLESALSLFPPQFLLLHPGSRRRCSSQSWSVQQGNIRESFSFKSAVPKLSCGPKWGCDPNTNPVSSNIFASVWHCVTT